METEISKIRFVVTGHNIEADGKVQHFMRPVDSDGKPLDRPIIMENRNIVTDTNSIIPDGAYLNVRSTYTLE